MLRFPASVFFALILLMHASAIVPAAHWDGARDTGEVLTESVISVPTAKAAADTVHLPPTVLATGTPVSHCASTCPAILGDEFSVLGPSGDRPTLRPGRRLHAAVVAVHFRPPIGTRVLS